ncbi:MAG: hypothetical protein J1F28_05280 [Oscillospiraceae bacterium]|nr:hypothetical protein [Oscillospiraceae bacterium]
MSKDTVKTRRGFKEFVRKLIVSLKRSPQNISLVALAVAFLVYSLNLTSISNTTALIQGPNMGQCEFAAMLFSILAFVVFLRSFPKRQKANKVMIALLFLFLILTVGVDILYLMRINNAITRTDELKIDFAWPGRNPDFPDGKNVFVGVAQNIVTVHAIFVVVCALLVALLPLYSKLIRKINTSIEVEENLNMGTIDISGED